LLRISRQTKISIVEDPFLSIEGEGIHIGKPMTFIRLARCNLRCVWCDTKYSWEEGQNYSVTDLVNKLDMLGCINICLTGGEPLLQPNGVLELLKSIYNKITYLNTNGTIWNKRIFDKVNWINCDIKTPSSGMKSNSTIINNLVRNYPKKLQLKIVVMPEDLRFTRSLLDKISTDIPVTIQPEFNSYSGSITVDLFMLIINNFKERKNIRVLPQLHKILWPNIDRGI